MAASPDDRIPSPQTDRSHSSDRSQHRILSQFQGDWVNRLNLDQMYVLIDGVLPFEACLYYQVLPLFLDGNRLNLGMVSPEDITAADYVRRIISYLNYSLVVRRITADALQTTLTAYLNAAENKQAAPGQPERVSFGHYRHTGRNRGTRPIDQSERMTLVVDSPDELDEPGNPAEAARPDPPDAPQPPAIALPQPEPAEDTAHSRNNALPEADQTLAPDLDSDPSSALRTPAPQPSRTPHDSLRPLILPLLPQLPVLQLQARYLSAASEELLALPPDIILQELLARVLIGGIGRLYFENHTHYGRILWSQNGVLQSVLENVPIALFQALLTALKQTANLAFPIEEYPKQVEAEYLYNGLSGSQGGITQGGSRVMLRFRFMINAGNEEATLQILRGAALRFHQQQQMRKLERDAVGIAKQLQVKLSEIRDRTLAVGGLTSSRFEVLPGLSHLLHRIEQQLSELGVSRSDLTES